MQPVKITIESHAKGLNEDDCLQTIFFGQMTERDEKFYVVYEETAATGLEGTKTTIKWDMERVVILRHGKLEHRTIFYTKLLIWTFLLLLKQKIALLRATMIVGSYALNIVLK